MEQKKPRRFHLFPQAAKTKFYLGAWWIFEAIMIETPIFFYIASKYEVEILGPVNIIYFISSLLAVIYGAICMGLGYRQWSLEKFAKKPL